MAQYTARDVAEYFLRQTDEESGDLISNLKLQKLVYYAQCLHLAIFEKPLFDDEIVAWMHGPVVVDLYHDYKEFGGSAIVLNDLQPSNLDEKTKEFLDEVYKALGQYSAWKLRDMTHKETPWINADNKGSGSVITHSDMQEFFKQWIRTS